MVIHPTVQVVRACKAAKMAVSRRKSTLRPSQPSTPRKAKRRNEKSAVFEASFRSTASEKIRIKTRTRTRTTMRRKKRKRTGRRKRPRKSESVNAKKKKSGKKRKSGINTIPTSPKTRTATGTVIEAKRTRKIKTSLIVTAPVAEAAATNEILATVL